MLVEGPSKVGRKTRRHGRVGATGRPHGVRPDRGLRRSAAVGGPDPAGGIEKADAFTLYGRMKRGISGFVGH